MDCFYHDCEEKKKDARKNIYMNMTMKLPSVTSTLEPGTLSTGRPPRDGLISVLSGG